ncbi:hypothetical protein PR048_018695, partial [Dryococelus australis]
MPYRRSLTNKSSVNHNTKEHARHGKTANKYFKNINTMFAAQYQNATEEIQPPMFKFNIMFSIEGKKFFQDFL